MRERGVLSPHLLAWLTWPSEAWAGEERFKAHVEEGETAAVQPDQGPEKGCKATTGTSGEQGQEPGVGTITWRRKRRSQGSAETATRDLARFTCQVLQTLVTLQ